MSKSKGSSKNPETPKRSSRRRQADSAQDATVRLERHFDEFDSRLSATVDHLEQQLRDTSALMIDQADAVARIIESAETSVSLLARLSAEAMQGGSGRSPTSGPKAPPSARGGDGQPLDSAGSLEGRVAELLARIEHLEAARVVADAGNQAKSCFLAAMGREMRTPVDGILRMIELLRDTELTREQERFLRTASYSANALLSLLDSVMSVARVDLAELDLRVTDFDLRRNVSRVVGAVLPVAKSRGLDATSHVPQEVPTLVRGDPGRLRQILLYATTRAIQLAQHGIVSLRAALESAGESVNVIRFTVHHAGTALTPEQRQDIFAPHAEACGAPVSTRGGSGLGMAIARQLVELMGGQMGFEFDGTPSFTIWMTIPLDRYRKPAEDRREHGRLPQELLHSSIGPVLDLSMGGMRVRCSRVPKGEVQVELVDLEAPLSLRAVVTWSRRVGFRKHEVGLSFIGVPPDVARQLTRISLNHRIRRLLGN